MCFLREAPRANQRCRTAANIQANIQVSRSRFPSGLSPPDCSFSSSPLRWSSLDSSRSLPLPRISATSSLAFPIAISAVPFKLPMTIFPCRWRPASLRSPLARLRFIGGCRCIFQQRSEGFVPVQRSVGSSRAPDISRPGRGCENLRKSFPTHLLDGVDNVDAGCPVLFLLTRGRNIVESAPEAVNPNRPFQLAARAGEPVAAGFVSDAHEIDRELRGRIRSCVFGRLGLGRARRQQEHQNYPGQHRSSAILSAEPGDSHPHVLIIHWRQISSVAVY